MARFREGTGTGLLVALGSLSIYSLFAWVLVVLLWIALSVYALVEMIGDGRPSPVAVRGRAAHRLRGPGAQQPRPLGRPSRGQDG